MRFALKSFGCGLTRRFPVLAEWQVRQTSPSGWHDWHDARLRLASAACPSGKEAVYRCPDGALRLWSLTDRLASPSRVWQFEQNCCSWQRAHCCWFVWACIGWMETQSLRWLSGLMSRLYWLPERFALMPPPLWQSWHVPWSWHSAQRASGRDARTRCSLSQPLPWFGWIPESLWHSAHSGSFSSR